MENNCYSGYSGPTVSTLKVSLPDRHVLLIALNRPKALNALTSQMEEELGNVLSWFDAEPNLRVMILTGEGPAFCVGGNLKQVVEAMSSGHQLSPDHFYGTTSSGFGCLSRRTESCKPIIAAVNGAAYGGGTEIIMNCDLVVASEKARFGTTEVSNGLVAIQGALPRMSRVVGHQIASEAYLMGRSISALEARDQYKFVNWVVPESKLLETALNVAQKIASTSPEAIQYTKRSLLLSKQLADVEEITRSQLYGAGSSKSRESVDLKRNLGVFLQRPRSSSCKL